MTHHSIDIRIYYEDTDAHGVVYHGSYLNFAERGRTELLRHIGYQNSDIKADHETLFFIRHAAVDYHLPAYLDDLLRLDSTVESMKKTSFVMKQTLYRPDKSGSGGDELIADIKVALVCVDANTLKPVAIPADVKSEFEKFI